MLVLQEKLGTRRADGTVVGAEAGGEPLNEADLDGQDVDPDGSVPLAAASGPVVSGQSPTPKQP